MRTIVRASLERGEQAMPETDLEEVVERTADVLLREGERLLRLSDSRAVQARTTETSDGGSLIVFSDVTAHREREERLRELNERLSTLASTDSLTGLTNRRAFDNALAKALIPGRRLSLLMIDVDSFKAYNDGYGHLEGDECLRQVADRLAETFAPVYGAVAARYGGEEFTILLPSVDLDEAQSLALMACNSVRGLSIPHTFSEKGVVTVSVGIACTASGSARELLNSADAGLYAAKAAGRDCTRTALTQRSTASLNSPH
ncbi:diguanylate cyclase [Rhizobium sp. S152]|uniref:GGDEF domain-containing protein n=1 Tax=Rhizobium sp. S152 TaxID=3055038 RepID=UPI0025A95E57|nr:GGDEF domain-containing protein [Rhizobium sp. S152]MDM9627652.1 diguanylate cyclase [Rhizobium sp. S152]